MEWIGAVALVAVLGSLWIPSFALLGLAVLLLLAVATLVALVAGVIAAPFVLAGAVRRRARGRRPRPTAAARPKVSKAEPHNATRPARPSTMPPRAAQAGLAARRSGHSGSNGAGARPTAPAPRTDQPARELLAHGQLSAKELGVLLELHGRRDANFHELAQALLVHPAALLPPARRLAMRGLIASHHDGTSEQALLAATPAGVRTVRGVLAEAEHVAATEPALARRSPGGAV